MTGRLCYFQNREPSNTYVLLYNCASTIKCIIQYSTVNIPEEYIDELQRKRDVCATWWGEDSLMPRPVGSKYCRQDRHWTSPGILIFESRSRHLTTYVLMAHFLWVFSMDQEQEKRPHFCCSSIPTSCWLEHATISDPDLEWIKMKSGLWIWIKESKTQTKVKKFHVLLCWMLSLGYLKLLL